MLPVALVEEKEVRIQFAYFDNIDMKQSVVRTPHSRGLGSSGWGCEIP